MVERIWLLERKQTYKQIADSCNASVKIQTLTDAKKSYDLTFREAKPDRCQVKVLQKETTNTFCSLIALDNATVDIQNKTTTKS